MNQKRAPTRIGRLLQGLAKIMIAALILWGIMTVPLPSFVPQMIVWVRVPAAVFVFIVYVGMTLYDTFFYEQP
jgi:hypothetical protein